MIHGTTPVIPDPDRPPAATAAGGALLGGRYRLGDLLGVGGSAAVYQAEDLLQPRPDGQPEPVAVKVLHAHLCATDAVRSAFLREAERAGQLRHPNIVAVRGSGLHDAGGVVMAWIALDLVAGPTLADWVEVAGPLPPAEAAAVLDGLLAGLEAAHGAGLVHRDVSPRNVVLNRAGETGRHPINAGMVRILDFGLADLAGRTTLGSDLLLADDGPQSVRRVVGNANYLSPEQAMGRPVAAAGDLYQAGGVLYFLLTGQPPYPRDQPQQVIDAHIAAPPPVPSALAPASFPLDRVVTTALAKQPERRFRDAGQFRAAIAEALSHIGAAQATQLRRTARGSERYSPTLILPLPGTARAGEGTRSWPRTPAPPPERGSGKLDYLDEPADRRARSTASAGATPATTGTAVTVAVLAVAGVAVLAVLSAFAGPGSRPAPVPTLTPTIQTPASSAAATSAPPRRTTVALVTVPTLHGTLPEAERALRAAGLALGEVTRVDSAEAAGTVLGQSPDPAEKVAQGSAVNLLLASGANKVPPVGGMNLAAAVAVIESAGFAVAADRPDATATTPVSDSEPVAGTVLRLGVTVTLILDGGGDATPSSTPSVVPSPQPSSTPQ